MKIIGVVLCAALVVGFFIYAAFSCPLNPEKKFVKAIQKHYNVSEWGTCFAITLKYIYGQKYFKEEEVTWAVADGPPDSSLQVMFSKPMFVPTGLMTGFWIIPDDFTRINVSEPVVSDGFYTLMISKEATGVAHFFEILGVEKWEEKSPGKFKVINR